jgi:hypothetical protein
MNAIPPQRTNWRLFIPVIMLFLAALACDEPYLDPPHVAWVETDTPGRAFAHVESTTSHISATYETDDYGQHWRTSDSAPSSIPPPDLKFTMRGETLYLNEQAIWSFPRPTFRFFFLDTSAYSGSQFRLPYGEVSAALQGDRLYAAMGTQGVLVGRLTNGGRLEDWQLTTNGMDTLKPLPLTITRPAEILGVTAFALFIPPYALLHLYLLYCLWAYLLPRDQARRYAIFTTLGLMVVASVGTVIWLTDTRTDYFPAVAVVAAITVLIGVGLTLMFASGKTDTPNKGWLVLAALLASLVAPAGVAAIFVGWWAVYMGVIGYAFFRWAYWSHFEPAGDDWRERWRVDRLALETLVVSTIIAVVLGGGGLWLYSTVLLSAYSTSRLWQGMVLIGAVIEFIVGVILVQRYVKLRLPQLGKAKNDHHEALPSALKRDIRIAIVGWLFFSGVATAATFVGQFVAYGWFTGLLR